MSEDIESLRRQIAELEAALQHPLPAIAADLIHQQLAALQSQLSINESNFTSANVAAQNIVGHDLNQQTGTAHNSAPNTGAVIGLNLGKIVFGRDPSEDEQRRLSRYLTALANKWSKLDLRGKDDRSGEDNQLSLARVYTMMGVEKTYLRLRTATKLEYTQFTDGFLKLDDSENPDMVLPHQAVSMFNLGEEAFFALRKMLVTEAVSYNPHLILLGEPGGGKSTFIRHLTMTLASHDPNRGSLSTQLPGWDDNRQLLPIIISLRELAGALAKDGASSKTVYTTLYQTMESYSVTNVDDLLSESLHRGVALLLFDGLDEVPLEGIPGEVADRMSALRAVRDFAQQHDGARVVVTCRTRAYEGKIRECVKWRVETLAPWTLGQIRHFVPAWYNELAATTGMEMTQAERAGRDLLEAIVERPKLAEMARTPLLLTMMALVLFNDGTLPRDRPQLYERVLSMLLGRWDSLRGGDNLATAIGHPNWDSGRIRVVLDELSYVAHREATSADGHGRISRAMLRDKLIEFFKNAGLPRYADAAERCLEYFQQRSGLLLPDDEHDSFMFAHLTLQEHCAGCYLVSQRSAVDDVMSHRNDDRFREPIFLGLGMLQEDKQGWLLIEKVLNRLISRDETYSQAKYTVRWQRDLILAAEIGIDRSWERLKELGVDTQPILIALQHGLVEILESNPPFLSVKNRVYAGTLLAAIGDPRPGVCTLEPVWCEVPSGPFLMGSNSGLSNEKPEHIVNVSAFRISKYAITNWQYQQFIRSTKHPESREAHNKSFSQSNQPVVGISWRDATSFCAWLSKQLGYEIRLPTEAEWEKAACGTFTFVIGYPWGSQWDESKANSFENGIESTVAVGCYPNGASVYGALDMCGNVWEWTCSVFNQYPFTHIEASFADNIEISMRGGSWNQNSQEVRCRYRGFGKYLGRSRYLGFRVVTGSANEHE
jgi:formylglycine-generating enzyme required for sulfatase activity